MGREACLIARNKVGHTCGTRPHTLLVRRTTQIPTGDARRITFSVVCREILIQVQIMVESSVEEVESPAEPEDDDYVGCFSDMVGDRILFTVETDAAMTIEVSPRDLL